MCCLESTVRADGLSNAAVPAIPETVTASQKRVVVHAAGFDGRRRRSTARIHSGAQNTRVKSTHEDDAGRKALHRVTTLTRWSGCPGK